MKIYRLWFAEGSFYSRPYVTKGAAKGAIKTMSYNRDYKKFIEIHEFEIAVIPNKIYNNEGEEK